MTTLTIRLPDEALAEEKYDLPIYAVLINILTPSQTLEIWI
jgi:hypothetical protein